MPSDGETYWVVKNVSTNTETVVSWKAARDYWRGEPIYDDFEVWVWEQRKNAGITEPYPEPTGYREPELAGQILWSGNITVKSPKFHRQVYGITGSTESSDD